MKRILAVILLMSPAWAQVATLTGRVTDPSGAVIPGASVTARSVDGNRGDDDDDGGGLLHPSVAATRAL